MSVDQLPLYMPNLVLIRDTNAAPSSPSQRQAQLFQAQLSPHELAYQESLIQEREEDIREIEAGVHELATIFRDLGVLVNQQGGMIGMSMPFATHSTSYSAFRQQTTLKTTLIVYIWTRLVLQKS